MIHKPLTIMLLEAHYNGDRGRRMFRRWGFNNIIEELNRHSVGNWMFWKDSDIKIIDIYQSSQFTHVILGIDNQLHWFFKSYLPQSFHPTQVVKLTNLQCRDDTPWLVTCDLNAFLSSLGKFGGSPISSKHCNIFQNWVQ